MAHPRVAAGVLFFDEEGRVLLVRPSYKPGWDIPGGYVEPGESPKQACVREVEEELGISPPIGGLLVVDWAPHPDEGDKVLFIFDGGELAAEHQKRIRPDPREIAQWSFEAADSVEDLMPARLSRRLSMAMNARRDGHGTYAEHGRVPP